MVRRVKLVILVVVASAGLLLFDSFGLSSSVASSLTFRLAATKQETGRAASGQKPIDPTAWGTSHAGKPVPEFVHGDECLFCHRNDIGPGWQKNTHGIAIRQSEDASEWRDVFKGQATLSTIAPQVEYFLGSRHR